MQEKYDVIVCVFSVSMKPENLRITNVTSRSFLITWDKPIRTYSAENYGYVLQVKDDKHACKEEVLYKCSDCEGGFQVKIKMNKIYTCILDWNQS
jgi:hypothetical protein